MDDRREARLQQQAAKAARDADAERVQIKTSPARLAPSWGCAEEATQMPTAPEQRWSPVCSCITSLARGSFCESVKAGVLACASLRAYSCGTAPDFHRLPPLRPGLRAFELRFVQHRVTLTYSLVRAEYSTRSGSREAASRATCASASALLACFALRDWLRIIQRTCPPLH